MDKWTALVWLCVAIIMVSIMATVSIAVKELNTTKRVAFENGYELTNYEPELGTGWYKVGTQRTITIGGGK